MNVRVVSDPEQLSLGNISFHPANSIDVRMGKVQIDGITNGNVTMTCLNY